MGTGVVDRENTVNPSRKAGKNGKNVISYLIARDGYGYFRRHHKRTESFSGGKARGGLELKLGDEWPVKLWVNIVFAMRP
jgi:hypothetical protein